MPFFALRKCSRLRQDTRERPEGRPLRVSQMLDFLSEPKKTPGSKQVTRWCLYESQISVVLTGLDDCVWTVYGAIDDYYEESAKDSVLQLHQEWLDGGKRSMRDPIERRSFLSPEAQVLWDARTYFLAVVDKRTQQIREEWHFIVQVLELRRGKLSRPFTKVFIFRRVIWQELLS
jgi:hypothetical protein